MLSIALPQNYTLFIEYSKHQDCNFYTLTAPNGLIIAIKRNIKDIKFVYRSMIENGYYIEASLVRKFNFTLSLKTDKIPL